MSRKARGFSSSTPRRSFDLFAPLTTRDPHVAFKRVLESPFHYAARQRMNDLFGRMGDPDGNFIKEFQSEGFHSRMFEIACYAYLEAQGLDIERLERPDFIVTDGQHRVAIEATTTNPPGDRRTDISVEKVLPLSEAEVLEKVSNEFPIRMGSALRSKLDKHYWELPGCKDLPLVFIIGPFHEAGSTTYIDDSLARYLYGIDSLDNWTIRNGVLVRGDVPVKTHTFGTKSIPSNFFAERDVEHISAIIFCNQFTVPRFYRMAAQVGAAPARVTDTRKGICLLPDEGPLDYEYVVNGRQTPHETWWQGVTVFHNPRARCPLPAELLACTSEYQFVAGRVERKVHDFHPLTSFMHGSVHPMEPELRARSWSDFEEARTRARTTIQTQWRKVAQRHTLGWVKPVAELARLAPYVLPSLQRIQERVTPWLPALMYQSRELSPREMVAAIPCFDARGNPYGARLASSAPLSREQAQALGTFSEALWFALAQGMLPPVENRKKLEAALSALTDPGLLSL